MENVSVPVRPSDSAVSPAGYCNGSTPIPMRLERIHRSNLIGMGVLPLQYPAGETAESLGLTGTETFSITGIAAINDGDTPRTVRVSTQDGKSFDAVVRIDTPGEADYYRHGGILQYVLRRMLRH